MNSRSLDSSGLFRGLAISGFLLCAITYTSMANAAGRCGFGYHRTIYGGCVLNHPGRWATPARAHPGCWRNAWGQLRCYRY
jgi:hypothetical protein